MTTKTIADNDIARVIFDTGWQGYEVVRMTQIVLAENLGDSYAININADSSVDVGLFSLNTKWVPAPTLYQRLTPFLAAGFAKRDVWDVWYNSAEMTGKTHAERVDYASRQGWMAFSSKNFPQFRPRALAAAKAVGAI